MVGVFPVIKLGVLFIKQISKPLTKVFVNQAKNHPVFKKYIIIPPAYFYHWAEVKIDNYINTNKKITKPAQISEQKAIDLGAELLGEIIIFGVAGGCLLFEYSRQQAKEAKKEQKRQELEAQEREEFSRKTAELELLMQKHQKDIDKLKAGIKELTESVETLQINNKVKGQNNNSCRKEGQ